MTDNLFSLRGRSVKYQVENMLHVLKNTLRCVPIDKYISISIYRLYHLRLNN